MNLRPTGRSLILAAAFAGLALPAKAVQEGARAPAVTPEAGTCLPAEAGAKDAPLPPPILYEGLGYAGIQPDTADREAKRWFEQGVRLIWAYDEVEAIRAFAEAQKRDPSCALCFWGEAWARGPTLNLQPRTEELGKASAAAKRAASLSARLGPRDKALVAAMLVRTGGTKEFESKRYKKAMAKLARRFPEDDAVLVMAADAEIILDARADRLKEGSDAQRRLETVLARNPDHSGAIHLYIHLTDVIDRQGLAERYADRLGRLAPGASHLVHMPSHTFYGVGRYGDAAAVNLAALAADQAFAAKARPAPSDYRKGLYAHNSHFAIESALMRGDGPTALKIADHFAEQYPEAEGPARMTVIRAAGWYARGLHAPVAEVLAIPQPANPLMRAMRLYARGEALARKGDAASVRAEAAAMAALRAGPDGRGLGSRPVEALVEVAQGVLEGRAAMLDGRHAEAAARFRAAMTAQETAGFGSDPPPFWYPVRRSLAAALLASGDAAGARLQLLASLREWPRDPLALYALSKAEAALGRRKEAAAHLDWARRGWAGEVTAVPLPLI